MIKLNLNRMTEPDLLQAYTAVLDELRARDIVRSTNNPVGDYGEALFCEAFKWRRADKSVKGYDAIGRGGIHYEVKSRRLTPHNMSRRMGALRSFTSFEFLAGVLFNADFTVYRAALIPAKIVERYSQRVAHTNSWAFHLRDIVWTEPGVKDATDKLVRTLAKRIA